MDRLHYIAATLKHLRGHLWHPRLVRPIPPISPSCSSWLVGAEKRVVSGVRLTLPRPSWRPQLWPSRAFCSRELESMFAESPSGHIDVWRGSFSGSSCIYRESLRRACTGSAAIVETAPNRCFRLMPTSDLCALHQWRRQTSTLTQAPQIGLSITMGRTSCDPFPANTRTFIGLAASLN